MPGIKQFIIKTGMPLLSYKESYDNNPVVVVVSDVTCDLWETLWCHDSVAACNIVNISLNCEWGRDLSCRWRLEIGKNAGNQWSLTKNQLGISQGKYIFSERWRSLLSEYMYFSRLICNWFLVTLHWFPAFSRISDRHLQQESRPRSHMMSYRAMPHGICLTHAYYKYFSNIWESFAFFPTARIFLLPHLLTAFPKIPGSKRTIYYKKPIFTAS